MGVRTENISQSNAIMVIKKAFVGYVNENRKECIE